MEKEKFILAFVDKDNAKDLLQQFINDGAERGVIFDGLNINEELVECFREMKSRGYFPIGVIIDPTSNSTEFVYQRHPNQHESSKLIETIDTKSTDL